MVMENRQEIMPMFLQDQSPAPDSDTGLQSCINLEVLPDTGISGPLWIGWDDWDVWLFQQHHSFIS